MLFSRFLLSAYLKNGLTYKVGRSLLASDAQSSCGTVDSEAKGAVVTNAGSDKGPEKVALILRVFQDEHGKREFGPFGQELDKKIGGRLSRYLQKVKKDFKVGDTFVVPDVDVYEAVALTCVGPKNAGVNKREALNEKKENTRRCFGSAYKALKLIMRDWDDLEHDLHDDEAAQAAHEGFRLAKWTPSYKFGQAQAQAQGLKEGYAEGVIRADSQNFARYLSQQPPNKLTPVDVVKEAQKQLSNLDVKVEQYGAKEIQERNMTAFLAVAQGSSAEPKLLVCHYKNKKQTPRVLMVAKGVTFDSGGLCLKKREDMLHNCGMTGAAVALGTIRGVAALKVPVNLTVVIPLCENMISGQCLKVGDVVPTLKGHNVKIEDTDLEGHLMLADALAYGQKLYKPKYTINVASLTPGITQAIGSSCYGCFTNNENLWRIARDAGIQTGDRPWRFPIWNCFRKQITGKTKLFDLKNRGSGVASHCIGAAFLNNFVSGDWLHYDITGVGKMSADEAPPYLDPELMTGRPTRAFISVIMALANAKHDNNQ